MPFVFNKSTIFIIFLLLGIDALQALCNDTQINEHGQQHNAQTTKQHSNGSGSEEEKSYAWWYIITLIVFTSLVIIAFIFENIIHKVTHVSNWFVVQTNYCSYK